MRSLVLVGHGSHALSQTSTSVHLLAERLRERRVVHDVVEAFWKDEPSLRQVLRVTGTTDITVIPMFLSPGYFTEVVVPRELGLGYQGAVPPEGVARVLGGKTVRYLPPYGVHPGMAQVIRACALDTKAPLPPQETALVILGHEAGRQGAQRALEDHAQTLRDQGEFAQVQVLFMGEETRCGEWRQQCQAKQVIVVPFFSTTPQSGLKDALGLASPCLPDPAKPDPDNPDSDDVFISEPVGTHGGVLEVLVELTQQVRRSDEFSGDADRAYLSAWTQFMQLARRGLRAGEVLITPHGPLFDLRHHLDEHRPSTELTTYVTPEGLRDATLLDAAGQYRPVRTMRTLPQHWRGVFSEDDLPRAMHYLYPAAVEEAYACGCHSLRSTPWPTTARRQTGNYARVQKATPAQVAQVSKKVCSGCLRRRLWAGEALHQTFLAGVPGGLPCAEACTYLIAQVRDHMNEK